MGMPKSGIAKPLQKVGYFEKKLQAFETITFLMRFNRLLKVIF